MKLKLLILFVILSNIILAQKLFPEKCVGNWEGKMVMVLYGEVKDSVDVKMTISESIKDSVWNWKTEYLSPQKPVTKNYKLKLIDSKTGKFVIDEGQGIELKAYQFGDKLYSNFSVNTTILTSAYEIKNDKLLFEITSGERADKLPFNISNFSIVSIQRTVLNRVSKN